MSNRRIAFLRVVGPLDPVTGNAASAVLYSVRIDGTHLRRLSEPGIDWVYEDRYARVSRDGSYLTFQRLRLADFKAALFRMAPDGSHVRQLTSWELNADLYDLSTARSGPTKDLIAFQSVGRSGPQWSPDSTSLVVIDRSNIDDPNAEIWTTRFGGTGGPAAQHLELRQLRLPARVGSVTACGRHRPALDGNHRRRSCRSPRGSR